MPRSPSSPGREPGPVPGEVAAPDFDEVYLDGRRRLLLQAYVLTGDLAASQSAVRDAYVAAAQRWRSVGQLADPEEWVRVQTWSLAQRRHVGRRRDRDPALDAESRQVLSAVLALPDRQRRTLLLVHLAGLDLADVARELGLPVARAATLLERARARLRRRAGLDPAPPQPTRHDGNQSGTSGVPSPDRVVTAALESLAPDDVLPAADRLRRRAGWRTLHRVLAGTAAAVALTLLGGLVVLQPGSADEEGAAPQGPPARPVTTQMLLDDADAALLDRDQDWRQTRTSDNTEGDGLNTACQASRFADPAGEGTLVRSIRSAGEPRRTLLQTVEVSSTTTAATDAYATTLGWFAGCTARRLQLLDSYRVTGLGARAEVLRLRLPSVGGQRSYVVGLARTDRVTLSLVAETRGGEAVPVRRVATLLERGVRRLCDADPAGSCPTGSEVRRILPPPSGETVGTLAAADLPPLDDVRRPWVGTRPVSAGPGDAATSCDGTRFRRAGAPDADTRTYVIPGADLPPRVGVTQTVGTFDSPRRARAVLGGVVDAMADCEDDDLAASVGQQQVDDDGFRGSQVALWRLDREVADDRSVGYWMAVARVGPHLTQVLFTPSGDADIDQATFRALADRARDRLFELTGGTR